MPLSKTFLEVRKQNSLPLYSFLIAPTESTRAAMPKMLCNLMQTRHNGLTIKNTVLFCVDEVCVKESLVCMGHESLLGFALSQSKALARTVSAHLAKPFVRKWGAHDGTIGSYQEHEFGDIRIKSYRVSVFSRLYRSCCFGGRSGWWSYQHQRSQKCSVNHKN